MPSDSAEVISPGTAKTSRPSSSARSAVISARSAPAPPRRPSPSAAGDDPVPRREAPRRRLDAGCVLRDDQPPLGDPRASSGFDGRIVAVDPAAEHGDGEAGPASSAPRCASPSTPRASPLTTTRPAAASSRPSSARRPSRRPSTSARRRPRPPAGRAAPARRRRAGTAPAAGRGSRGAAAETPGPSAPTKPNPRRSRLGVVAAGVEASRAKRRTGRSRGSATTCAPVSAANAARASSLIAAASSRGER